MFIVDRMAGRQVMAGISAPQVGSGRVGPSLIPKEVEIVAEVPGHIGKSSEPGRGVAIIAMLIFAAGRRMFFSSAVLRTLAFDCAAVFVTRERRAGTNGDLEPQKGN